MSATTRELVVLVLATVQTLVLAWIAAWQRAQIARGVQREERLVAEVQTLRAPLAKVQETLKQAVANPEVKP